MTAFLIACSIQVTLVSVAAMLLWLFASRRRPSVRAAVIGTAMLAIAALTVVCVCPLPGWWGLLPDVTSAPGAGTSFARGASPEGNAGAHASPRNAAERPQRGAVDGGVPLVSHTVRLLGQALGDPSMAKSPALRTWPRTLLLAIAFGAGVLLLRFALGLQAIHRLYRRSRPLADARVDELLARVQQSAPCPRRIPIRESAQLGAAATIGWLRPVIVVPAGWSDWSAGELLAVLAHEVAHVCRRDYSMRLIAQVVAALHFYHPLIHWLAHRLVQEQELAADTLAATLVGGRRRYLHALSRMALRQDNRPKVWPGSIALPVSSRFLMRRIEMLRARDGSERDSATKTAQWALVAVLVLLSVGATAIRGAAQKSDEAAPARVASRIVGTASGPDARIAPPGQEQAPSPDADLFRQKPFDPSMLAGEGRAVFVVRPAGLFRRAEMQPLTDAWNQGLLQWMEESAADETPPLEIDEIELLAADIEIVFDRRGAPKDHRIMFGAGRVMIRTTRPFDWKRFLLTGFPETIRKEYRQREYLELPVIPSLGPRQSCVYVPDGRTMVFLGMFGDGGARPGEAIIDRHVDGPPRYDWADPWAAIDGGLITIAFDNRSYWWLRFRGIEDDLWKPFVGPLLDGAPFICLGADWSEATNRFVVRGRAVSDRPDQSDQFKQTVEALLGMARLAVKSDVSLDKDRKRIWGHVLSFLESASYQSANTSDGQSVVDARMETDLPVDWFLDVMLDSAGGS